MKPQLFASLLVLLAGLAGPVMAQVPGGSGGGFPGGPLTGPPDEGRRPHLRDVAMAKRAIGPVIAGQTATFSLQVTNSGAIPVNGGMGVQVIDVLPAGFTGPISGAGAGWACAAFGSTLTCNWVGGGVPPGGSFPPITVTAVAGGSGEYENCAQVRLTRAQDMRPNNDRSCVKGPVGKREGRRHDVGLRKTGPASVVAGQSATFTLLVTNNGPSPVNAGSGLTVVDSLPANFTNVTASGPGWTCTVAGQPAQVECSWVGSPVNAPLQFPAIVITAIARKEGVYLNCAEAILRKDQDVALRDNRSCMEGRVTEGGGKGYDVGIRKVFKPTNEPGSPGIFVLYPTNNGPATVSAATGLQVVDTLPANFVPPIAAGGGDWTCTTQAAAGGGSPWTVVCDYVGPPAGPGPLPEIELTAAVGKAGPFNNCAEILLHKDRDLNPRDNRGCAGGEVSTAAGKKPDVALSKTALEQPWSWPSGTGVYRFRIDNVGDTPVPAGHTFTLTENLPAGMVMVSMANAWACTPGSGTTGPATITCTYTSGAPLNPGAWIQFDMIVGFTRKKEPAYLNCASVAVADKDRPWREVNMANNRDCEPVEIRPTPRVSDLKMEKRGPATLIVGQSATYTLDVVNKGPDAVDAGAGIVVTDTLPALFTPPVSVAAPGWTCQVSGLAVSCSFIGQGVFNPGDGLPPITLTAVAGAAGQTQNCALVAKAGDPVAANNQACVPLTVRNPVPTMNLAVTKSVYGTWLPQGGYFQLDVTNASGGVIPAGTTVTVTDTLPPGMRFDGVQGPFTCTPVGAVGPTTITCTVTLGAALGAGQSLTAYLTMALMLPVQASYENCVSMSASVAETNLADNADCATVEPPPALPNLIIEKVVEQDCSGTSPYTACKFTIRIFNTGSTPYTGPLNFTDTVTGPSGITIGGVSLASPLPPGWSCTGSQPATCTIASATIPPNGGSITVPLNMSINGPIPPKQNCAALTAPTAARACVPMGSTHFDLGLDSSITESDLALNGATFEFRVSSTPTLANGAQLVFNGSVITSATFVPPALAPAVVSGTPLWTCTGPWSGFVCSLTVSAGAWSGGFIPLRLKVYYATTGVGMPVTFTGQIQMNGNVDPAPSNNSTSVTTVLP